MKLANLHGLLQRKLSPWPHRGGVFGSVRAIGDRLTGGGLRSLAKRMLSALVRRCIRHPGLLALGRAVLKPFPTLRASLYQLGTAPEPAAIARAPIPPALPASARPVFVRIQAAISDSNGWSRHR